MKTNFSDDNLDLFFAREIFDIWTVLRAFFDWLQSLTHDKDDLKRRVKALEADRDDRDAFDAVTRHRVKKLEEAQEAFYCD